MLFYSLNKNTQNCACTLAIYCLFYLMSANHYSTVIHCIYFHSLSTVRIKSSSWSSGHCSHYCVSLSTLGCIMLGVNTLHVESAGWESRSFVHTCGSALHQPPLLPLPGSPAAPRYPITQPLWSALSLLILKCKWRRQMQVKYRVETQEDPAEQNNSVVSHGG